MNDKHSFLCRKREENGFDSAYNEVEKEMEKMEWIMRLNDVIRYIEQHLTEEIDYEQLGKIACCSAYHFQRMFSYMAGISLSEYIRRRKMSLAAVDLQGGDQKIVDIALKYGYGSPTAFNRAFQSVHGIAPSLVKKEGVSVKSFPPLLFQMIVKGVEEMEYRIEKKDAFRILGVSQPLEKDMEKNFAVVPRMWQEVTENGILQKLAGMIGSPPMGILGVCASHLEQWKYFIGVASMAKDTDLEEYFVPALTWAVFRGEGVCPQAIQELEARIFTEWLPASGYEYANGPDMEVYLNMEPSDSQFEVWIPVVKQSGSNPEA